MVQRQKNYNDTLIIRQQMCEKIPLKSMECKIQSIKQMDSIQWYHYQLEKKKMD